MNLNNKKKMEKKNNKNLTMKIKMKYRRSWVKMKWKNLERKNSKNLTKNLMEV